MYCDRDFDPLQAFRDLMYRFRDAEAQPGLPPLQAALVQDLELDTLVQAMAGDDKLLRAVVRKALLTGTTNDVDTILYRQAVLRDCLKNTAIVRQLYDLTTETVEKTKRGWWELSSRYPSSLLYNSIDLLEFLLSMLRKLRRVAEEHAGAFQSEAFSKLFSMLKAELGDEYLNQAQSHLEQSKFRKGVLLSAELGEWNESANLILRAPPERTRNWLERMLRNGPPSHTFHLAERDQAGASILSNIRYRGISRVALALAQSADHVLGFFRMLRTELAFYIGCLNLHSRLASKGEPVCLPTPVPAGARKHRFSGLYDVCLSLRLPSRVVGNTANADHKNLIIVTGANQGGKSTFLRSIGLAQLMMQCGMFVGAEAFEVEIFHSLFTHYKREEDPTMKSGKFDEELARMSDIADSVVANSMLLFNESFAATNEREGSEIGRQIVSALLEKQIKVFYVTHLYEFARGFVGERPGGVMFLRAERRPDGTRTFKVIEGEPLETSFGEDLYHKTFDSRTHREDRHAAD